MKIPSWSMSLAKGRLNRGESFSPRIHPSPSPSPPPLFSDAFRVVRGSSFCARFAHANSVASEERTTGLDFRDWSATFIRSWGNSGNGHLPDKRVAAGVKISPTHIQVGCKFFSFTRASVTFVDGIQMCHKFLTKFCCNIELWSMLHGYLISFLDLVHQINLTWYRAFLH